MTNRAELRSSSGSWRRVQKRSALAAASMAILVGATTAAPLRAQPATDPPDVLRHVTQARTLAGDDLQTPLFLCRPDSGAVVRQALDTGSSQWIEPTQLFDNLFYVGNRFVGVLVLKTSQGLILFDSSSSPDEAEHHLVPGLRALGLDPKTIRYVIVTHGHWDHFGGAAWLQRTYDARVGLSQADWEMIEREPVDSPGTGGHARPRRDLVIRDGQSLSLGDTRVTLYVTPGHTPGAVSVLIPAREGGRTHLLSLLGSVAFPLSLQPTPTTGGLLAYDASIKRFASLSRDAGADAIFNTHVFADGSLDRLQAKRTRAPAAANPFLVGPSVVSRYYALFDQCLQAAIARPHDETDANKPTVPPK